MCIDGLQLAGLFLVGNAVLPGSSGSGLVLRILVVDGVPWLINELLVEGAALFQGVDKGLCLVAFRPSETTEQKRGRTRVRERERRQARERELQGGNEGAEG